MIFREFEENDVHQLSALASYVWCNTYCSEGIRDIESQYMLSQFSNEKFIEILKSSSKTCVVAQNANIIQGLCILDFNSKYNGNLEFGDEITNFYVFPDLQRKGIGHSLLENVYKKFGSNKWLTTWVHNQRAINFYNKLKFNVIGTTEFNLFGEIHRNHVFHHK